MGRVVNPVFDELAADVDRHHFAQHQPGLSRVAGLGLELHNLGPTALE